MFVSQYILFRFFFSVLCMQLRFSLNLLLFLTGINLSHEKQPYNRLQQQNATQFPIEKKSQNYFVFIEMQLLFT